MTSKKLEAETLRIGILDGYIQPYEAIAWADAQIADSQAASAELIDISLSGCRGAAEVAEALAKVSGVVSENELGAALLRRMADAVFVQPSLGRQVARAMYRLALEGFAPTSDAESAMLMFNDAYRLADSGVFGSPQQVEPELLEYLSTWRTAVA